MCIYYELVPRNCSIFFAIRNMINFVNVVKLDMSAAYSSTTSKWHSL